MGGKKKSWREKLADNKDLPKIVKLNAKQSKVWGEGTMAIPAPKEVDSIMKRVPKGKLVTVNVIRQKIAKRYKVTFGCPICTGIFSCIAARAAEEDLVEGKKSITPYWRTLKSKGELNEKYPGGVASQAKRLKSEGHSIIPAKGKKPPLVKDFEKKLVKA